MAQYNVSSTGMTEFFTTGFDSLMMGWGGESILAALFIIAFITSLQANNGTDSFAYASYFTFILATLELGLGMITVVGWMITLFMAVGGVAATSTASRGGGVGI